MINTITPPPPRATIQPFALADRSKVAPALVRISLAANLG
jgi:hypothetical protein